MRIGVAMGRSVYTPPLFSRPMLRSPWLVASFLFPALACSPASENTTPADTSSSGSADLTDDSGQSPESSDGASDSGASSGSATSSTGTEAGSSDDASAESSGEDCPIGTQGCPCREDACDGDELECVDGVCVAPVACAESIDLEPNDEESTAIDLGEVACGEPVAAAQGSIGTDEIDWWTYRGLADGECDESMVIVTADADLEVCAYFECDMGGENVNCVGSRSATSPDGREGCCGDGYVTSANACVGMSSNGVVLIGVSGPVEPMCVEYELAYLFG